MGDYLGDYRSNHNHWNIVLESGTLVYRRHFLASGDCVL